mgnify:CR=1 FL=1
MREPRMISYAQQQEDVRLARAFAGVSRGVYVDVGAHDDRAASVTRHFYDAGWSGINVEPLADRAERLRAARPRDVTLAVALSDREGEETLYELPRSPALSTLDAAAARAAAGSGAEVVERRVPVTTLAAVWAAHGGERCDFLKIDVEGHEAAVLRGANLTAFRPRVVLVEAVAPGSTRPTHAAWEPLLLAAGYVPAAFDGLNRYYVADDSADLAPALAAPVTVLDDFEPWELHRLRTENAALRARLASLPHRAASALERLLGRRRP